MVCAKVLNKMSAPAVNSVLFQQFDLKLNKISPPSSVTPAKGPVPSLSKFASYALVIMTWPSAEAEATARPEPGSNLTLVTLSLWRGFPRGGSSVYERATQNWRSLL